MAVASVVIHFGYYLTLAQAYRTGDLSFAYPLMRGTAPLLVTLLGIMFLRELPSAQDRDRHPAHLRRHRRHRVRAAPSSPARRGLLGARQRGDHRASTRWSTAPARARRATRCRTSSGSRSSRACSSSPGCAGARARRRSPTSARQWRRGLLGGFCSVAAYGIVLWAMTRAPVAAVAALRETSVLFAAIIGTVLLKEGFGARTPRGRGERGRRRGRAQALTERLMTSIPTHARVVIIGGGIAGAPPRIT